MRWSPKRAESGKRRAPAACVCVPRPARALDQAVGGATGLGVIGASTLSCWVITLLFIGIGIVVLVELVHLF